MIVTTIKFVGLLVTTLLAPPNPRGGVQVIMGNFAPLVPPHTQLIAWPKWSRVSLPPSEEWPKNPKGFPDARGIPYEYSLVNIENVTISGPTEAFNNPMWNQAIPHLTC